MRWIARVFWIFATLALGLAPSALFAVWVEAMARDQGFALMCAWVVGWPLVVLPGQPWIARVAFDVALLLAFGALHSGLAQLPAHERISRVIGAAHARAFYMVATGVALLIVMAAWQTLGGTCWELVPNSPLADRAGQAGFYVLLGLAGYAIAGPGALEFTGLAPAWRGATLAERTAGNPRLVETGAYRWVRHPGYALTLAAFLCANRMTYDRLAVLAGSLAYLLAFGIPLEERKLIAIFGDAYAAYRRRVPALVPFLLGVPLVICSAAHATPVRAVVSWPGAVQVQGEVSLELAGGPVAGEVRFAGFGQPRREGPQGGGRVVRPRPRGLRASRDLELPSERKRSSGATSDLELVPAAPAAVEANALAPEGQEATRLLGRYR